jgi:nondiscriminating glutamyl-tRNA synthetase
MNGNYIRKLMKSDCKNLSEKLKNILIKFNKIDKNFPDEKLAIITNLLGDKIETLNQILDFSGLLFEDKFGEVDEEVKEYIESDEFKLSKKIMNDELEKLDELDNKNLMNIIKKIQTEAGIKGKKLYTILRILITGKAEGPDLALLYSFFGKVGILKRIENFK